MYSKPKLAYDITDEWFYGYNLSNRCVLVLMFFLFLLSSLADRFDLCNQATVFSRGGGDLRGDDGPRDGDGLRMKSNDYHKNIF